MLKKYNNRISNIQLEMKHISEKHGTRKFTQDPLAFSFRITQPPIRIYRTELLLTKDLQKDLQTCVSSEDERQEGGWRWGGSGRKAYSSFSNFLACSLLPEVQNSLILYPP